MSQKPSLEEHVREIRDPERSFQNHDPIEVVRQCHEASPGVNRGLRPLCRDRCVDDLDRKHTRTLDCVRSCSRNSLLLRLRSWGRSRSLLLRFLLLWLMEMILLLMMVLGLESGRATISGAEDEQEGRIGEEKILCTPTSAELECGGVRREDRGWRRWRPGWMLP